jgi:tetratricopeptide (TPR) repeat protein
VEEGLKISATNPRLMWLRGVVHLQQGDSLRGSAELKAALASPSVGPDVKLIADAYQEFEKTHDGAAMLRALLAVTRKYPTSYLAWRELTNARAQAGDTNGAVDAATTAAAVLPADPRAAQLATEVLSFAGKLDRAALMAQRWRELIPARPLPADLARARIEYKRRDFRAAASILEPSRDQLIKDERKDPEALGLYAACLAGAGRQTEAAEILKVRAQSGPDWKARYFRVTEALLPNADAARAWMATLPATPADPPPVQLLAAETWFQIGLASKKPDDLDESVRLARLAAEGEGLRGPASAVLGSVLQAAGDPARAVEAYRVASAELPDNPSILNNLAYAITRVGPSEEAVVVAQRATTLSRAQGAPVEAQQACFDTLGQAAMALGDFNQAKQAFRAGLALRADAPKLLVGLAECMASTGNQGELKTLLAQITAVPTTRLDSELRRRVDRLRGPAASSDSVRDEN